MNKWQIRALYQNRLIGYGQALIILRNHLGCFGTATAMDFLKQDCSRAKDLFLSRGMGR